MAFSWFKSRKDDKREEMAYTPAQEDIVEVPQWPVPQGNPGTVPEDYGRTEAVYPYPQWDEPATMPAQPVEDYGRTEPIYDYPQWDEPATMPAQPVEDYGRTEPIYDYPQWDEPAPVPNQAAVEDYAPTEAVLDYPQWDEPALMPAWGEADYAPTEAVFAEPDLEEEDWLAVAREASAAMAQEQQYPLKEELPAWDMESPEVTAPAQSMEADYAPTVAAVAAPVWEETAPVQVVEDYPPTESDYTAPQWEEPAIEPAPVVEDDYAPTVAAVAAPVWEEIAPVQVVEDYLPTESDYTAPQWEEPEPEPAPVMEEDYTPTEAVELPEEDWLAVAREATAAMAQEQPASEAERYQLMEELPDWDMEIPEETAPVQNAPEDYAPTVAVFEEPVWEETAPAWNDPPAETAPASGEREGDDSPTAAVLEQPQWEEPEPPAPAAEEPRQERRIVPSLNEDDPCVRYVDSPEEGRRTAVTGEGMEFPPARMKEYQAPAAAPVRAAMQQAPKVPDFGRTISAERCDFTLRQQWSWLARLNAVIPTLRLGTEPACVDYPLTIRNMEAAGDMRITVKRVAMGIGTMLSITNLENAVVCTDVDKLRDAAQILTAYGKLVTGRQEAAIRMTIRYLGVRVAELEMGMFPM